MLNYSVCNLFFQTGKVSLFHKHYFYLFLDDQMDKLIHWCFMTLCNINIFIHKLTVSSSHWNVKLFFLLRLQSCGQGFVTFALSFLPSTNSVLGVVLSFTIFGDRFVELTLPIRAYFLAHGSHLSVKGGVSQQAHMCRVVDMLSYHISTVR